MQNEQIISIYGDKYQKKQLEESKALLRSSTGRQEVVKQRPAGFLYTRTCAHTRIPYGVISLFDLNNCWQVMP